MENIIIILSVLCALVYVCYRTYKSYKTKSCGCGKGCSGCQQNKQENSQGCRCNLPIYEKK